MKNIGRKSMSAQSRPKVLEVAPKGGQGQLPADRECVPRITNNERSEIKNATIKRTKQLQKEHTPQGGKGCAL